MEAQRREDLRGNAGRAEIFVVMLLAIVIGGAIVWAITRPEDDGANDALSATTTSAAPTATTLPPPRAYKVTDGVNVRSGPSTTFGVVAQVQLGSDVLVMCRTEGQAITAPSGSTNQWLRVTVENKDGFVSAAYVDTKGDLINPGVIAVCPPT